MTKPYTVENPIEYARDVVGCDPFATFLGIEVEEVREGYARVGITVKPEFMNAVERAHGGFIHALADQAFAVACNSTGVMAIAVNFYINYLSSAVDGEKIFAEAMPVNVGRKVSVWSIQVRGAEDKLIATGVGTAYHK
ncbi:MAG TPA: PaaI family thioesterase [Spirochaetota bacterium]|nr:PaaI family thioesterase [Spirochaetota bacterium]HPV41989.1 PaaI family thioesterase [Spirochaetota bacterium]